MYYGAGLLSTIDRYPERRINRPPPAPTRGRRGRPTDKSVPKNIQKNRKTKTKDGQVESGNDAVSINSI